MKVAALLSGGVDSSLALARLVAAGHDVTAFYLRIWLEQDLHFLGDCPWVEDLRYARALCERLGVPLEVVPLQDEYRERVVAYTVAEARAGRTPNPDVLCNVEIKFGCFQDVLGDDFERVATGHYARRLERDGRPALGRAPDPVKDQTYFLARLRPDQLARALFPVGELTKAEVRREGRALALPAAERKDSQGLCFLGKVSFRAFLRHHLGERAGPIVERASGRVLGEHRGHWFHTIGQRKGLGLSGGPWFVVGKDPDADVLWVERRQGPPPGPRSTFPVTHLHWLAGQPPRCERLEVKLRHGPALSACRLERAGPDRATVALERGDPGIAPGQFAVFYDGELCLGSGMIDAGDPERASP